MDGRSLSILLVEDGATYGRLATFLLQGLGHRVTLVDRAEEGLRLAREIPPDLILMDLNLPGMDGYAAAEAIRADLLLHSIPTIALTAERLDQSPDPRSRFFTAMAEKPIYAEAFRLLLAPFAEATAR
jgi:two-component system cell cycle response regulator DivK